MILFVIALMLPLNPTHKHVNDDGISLQFNPVIFGIMISGVYCCGMAEDGLIVSITFKATITAPISMQYH